MLGKRSNSRLRAIVTALIAIGATAALAGPAWANSYRQTNLVSDIPGVARVTNPNLVNPWGLAAGPTTPLWVNDNGTDLSELYTGAVNNSIPTLLFGVNIPGGAPTGIVFNGSATPTDFQITDAAGTGEARFIFASETGHITAWRPTSPLLLDAVNEFTSPTAIYKGLAILIRADGSRLYAANFHDNSIDVFGPAFQPVHLAPGAFTDPNIPAGFAPFTVQALNGQKLYVSYAKQDAGAEDDVPG